ncbi:Na+/glutamate symporter [Arthrobacter sp. B3I4]|nr:Na+/glutamate symporter [Arthrobacter sp. B3I4]
MGTALGVGSAEAVAVGVTSGEAAVGVGVGPELLSLLGVDVGVGATAVPVGLVGGAGAVVADTGAIAPRESMPAKAAAAQMRPMGLLINESPKIPS